MLSFEQRAWLRAYLDHLARERIADQGPGAARCLGRPKAKQRLGPGSEVRWLELRLSRRQRSNADQNATTPASVY